jgi:hypothetical protein
MFDAQVYEGKSYSVQTRPNDDLFWVYLVLCNLSFEELLTEKEFLNLDKSLLED